MNKTKEKKESTPEQELALIRKKLKHPTREDTRYWLDTGNPKLNSVLGSEEKGLPYGKMFEVSGWESHGKTALMYEVAGYAQRDGATVAIWDLENTWDPLWARQRGLDPDKVMVFSPVMGVFGNEKQKRMITAEEQCQEIEMWMQLKNEANPDGRMFLGVDSVAAISPKDEEEAGLEQNMRTKVSIASLLSWLLKRWQNLALNYNAMIFLLNQIRLSPGVRFGNPEYSPGGNALRFYCAIRAKVHRKSGKLLKNGKSVGFKGTITNRKNKSGEASREGIKIGFKFFFTGRSKYVDESEVKSVKEEG